MPKDLQLPKLQEPAQRNSSKKHLIALTALKHNFTSLGCFWAVFPASTDSVGSIVPIKLTNSNTYFVL